MKVRYTFPVRGKLRKSGAGEICLSEWLFRFEVGVDADYIERLVVEISDIPRENWPTLSKVEQGHNAITLTFPFAVNRQAHSFREIEPYLINLESYLSVFGLEEIVFSELSVEWIPEDGDEAVGMRSGYSISVAERHHPAEPLSDEGLARCIVAANAGTNKTAGLAHFRVALTNFYQQRYIETIRHAYLCLEQLFARGKHQENATIKEFKKSKELTSAITGICFNDTGLSKYFDRVREKHEELAEISNVEDILKFLFRLRGELQHAKPGVHSKWHPSRQHEYEAEALFLINLADDICFQIVVNDMQGVPREPK